MFIQLLDTTSGMDWENGKMVDVPKKVKVRLGTCGFRSLDGRYKNITTIKDIAIDMMTKQHNKVGYAIYDGTINNPRLVSSYITKDYSQLETDLENA
jgi:hypothetical protein